MPPQCAKRPWLQRHLDGRRSESTGDPGASIYIFNSTTFLINTDATKLGASLIVGESQSGANSPGVVNLADPTFQSGMSGNLTLYQNAGMTIMPTGTLNLNQSFFSNTKGGIAQAAGSTGAINNQGPLIALAPMPSMPCKSVCR